MTYVTQFWNSNMLPKKQTVGSEVKRATENWKIFYKIFFRNVFFNEWKLTISLFPYNSYKKKKISFPYTHKVNVQTVPTGLKGLSPCLFPVLSIHNFIRALVNLSKYVLVTYVILPLSSLIKRRLIFLIFAWLIILKKCVLN